MNNSYDSLPEYYLGRLILYEALSNNGCKWVVYDGHKKVRCPSRESALRYCEENSVNIPYQLQESLTAAYARILSGINRIEGATARYGGQHTADLNRIALRLRLLADQLDNITKQIKPIL